MRFLLVDRIDLVEDERIHGAKLVAMSEDYLEWHFPEQPILPGTLILEAASQLAAWHHAARSEFREWLLLEEVHSARYYHFAVPGDLLALEVTHRAGADTADGVRSYEAISRIDDRQTAVLEFSARVVPVDSLEDPARLERTYAGLTREGDRD